MINFKNVQIFCCDDISLIENYDKALNDKTQTWHCHHRLETDMHVSSYELIKRDLYFNRPASELIFMTKSEHSRIHSIGINNKMYGRKANLNPMYKKNPEDSMDIESIKEKRRKQSIAVLGNKNGRYHTKQMYKDGVYITVKYENIDEYLHNGWIIKGRPHNKNQSIL